MKVVRCYGLKVSYKCPVTKKIYGQFVEGGQLCAYIGEDDLDSYKSIHCDVKCKGCGKNHTVGIQTDYPDTIEE